MIDAVTEVGKLATWLKKRRVLEKKDPRTGGRVSKLLHPRVSKKSNTHSANLWINKIAQFSKQSSAVL